MILQSLNRNKCCSEFQFLENFSYILKSYRRIRAIIQIYLHFENNVTLKYLLRLTLRHKTPLILEFNNGGLEI